MELISTKNFILAVLLPFYTLHCVMFSYAMVLTFNLKITSEQRRSEILKTPMLGEKFISLNNGNKYDAGVTLYFASMFFPAWYFIVILLLS